MTQRLMVVVPAFAAIAVIATTFSLGQWQLRRAEEKSAILQSRELAAKQSPIELKAATLSAVNPSELAQKRVSIEGVLENDQSVFIDNRSHNGRAGFHVITPMKLAGAERRILVLRGWIERDIKDVTRAPQLKPFEAVTVAGLVELSLGKSFDLTQLRSVDPSGMPVPAKTQKIWQQFDPKPYGVWSGLDVMPFIVRQTSDLNDGLARQWTVKADDVSKHHGYAIQWFAMCATTFMLWLYFGLVKPYQNLRKLRIAKSNPSHEQ